MAFLGGGSTRTMFMRCSLRAVCGGQQREGTRKEQVKVAVTGWLCHAWEAGQTPRCPVFERYFELDSFSLVAGKWKWLRGRRWKRWK